MAGFEASAKCTEMIPKSSSLGCATNDSESADFASSCEYSPDAMEEVEVECPKVWVKATPKKSHLETCADHGMERAFLSGQYCASGINRPVLGEGASALTYPYGSGGKTVASRGGTEVTKQEVCTRNDREHTACVTWSTQYYCWNAMQEHAESSTSSAHSGVNMPGNQGLEPNENTVVAYLCSQ